MSGATPRKAAPPPNDRNANAERWLWQLYWELLRSSPHEPTHAERLVVCARELLPRDRPAATCVVGALLGEIRGRGRGLEKLATLTYEALLADDERRGPR